MTDNTLKPYVIGLDLGGTNSVFGIVDARRRDQSNNCHQDRRLRKG